MGGRFSTTAPRRSRIHRKLAGTLAMALLAVPLAAIAPGTAHADSTPPPAPPAVTDPEAIASGQAQASGTAVVVGADTTAYAQTTANPDGSLTLTDNSVPQRAPAPGGGWTAVDTTLQRLSDGAVAPGAVLSKVAFSGGGTGALATLTDANGRSLSLSWPTALPSPTLSGAKATYTSVFPGVDLTLTATAEGGYTEQLIVADATAAANPALQDIHFTAATNGLTLRKNSAGNLEADDTNGQAVFAAPTATMWSTPAAGTSTSILAPSGTAAAKTSVQAQASTAAGTGADASTATPVGLSVTGTSVDLTPPAAALTGAGVTYPVVIDPPLSPAAGTQAWTWISKVNSSTSYWKGTNNTHDTYGRVGFDDWCSDGTSGCTAFGVTRSMFQMGSISALHGKHVTAATFSVTEQGATSSWSGSRQMDLYTTNLIDQSTTWNSTPSPGATIANAQFPTLNSSTQQGMNFTGSALTQVIADDAASSSTISNQTFGLRADNEGDDTAYRYLIGGGATLAVTYWSTPNVPSSLSVTNGTKTLPCGGSTDTAAPGYWISGSDSRSITLNASINSPDVGYQVTSNFWTDKLKPTAGSWVNSGGETITSQSTPQPTHLTLSLADGDSYAWGATATDQTGQYTSAGAPSSTGACYFSVDFTAPTQPTIGTVTLPTGTSGASGSLKVSATDPGTYPSGVSHFAYNINGTSLTSGGHGEATVAASSGAATIPLSGDHWGTNWVWISTFDVAGNQSQPIHYAFYLPETNYTPGTSGDLDGDHKPDLAAIDSSGNIRVFSDPQANNPGSGSILIPATQAPNQVSFSGALLAHNGSFSGQYCDDLIVIQNGSLATDLNNNCAPAPSNTWSLGSGQARPDPGSGQVTGDTTNYNTTDWSSVRQLVALPPTAATHNRPALITLENDHGVWTMWEFTFLSAGIYNATLLATDTTTSHYLAGLTLISSGNINGTPALWVRNKTDGSLTQYLNIEADTTATLPAATTIAATGYRIGQYTALVSDGPVDQSINPALWATTRSGQLTQIPTTVNATTGATTTGTPVPITDQGWATTLQTLEGTYPQHPTSAIGVFNPTTAVFSLDNTNTTATDNTDLRFGNPGDISLAGDWNGDGIVTPGVYRPGNQTFYLTDSLTSGTADHTVHFGSDGDIPIVGDWNGDGTDTIGVY